MAVNHRVGGSNPSRGASLVQTGINPERLDTPSNYDFRKPLELTYPLWVTQVLNIAAVGIGGGLGAILRWLVAVLLSEHPLTSKFPLATFAVNIVGCILIGVYVAFDARGESHSVLRLFFVTGILGGFTTFSTFGLEAVVMIRGGHLFDAFLYVLLSVALGVCGVFAGLWLGARS